MWQSGVLCAETRGKCGDKYYLTIGMQCGNLPCLPVWYYPVGITYWIGYPMLLSSDWWEEFWWGNLNEEVALSFLLRLGLEGTGKFEWTFLGIILLKSVKKLGSMKRRKSVVLGEKPHY